MADPTPNIVNLGTEPVSNFVKALQEAESALKSELNKQSVRDEIVQGVFLFLETAIPVAAPVLSRIEGLVQKLAETGATP